MIFFSEEDLQQHEGRIIDKALAEKDAQYQQLMAQAVRLATLLLTNTSEAEQYTAGDAFLKSELVREFKEHHDTQG